LFFGNESDTKSGYAIPKQVIVKKNSLGGILFNGKF